MFAQKLSDIVGDRTLKNIQKRRYSSNFLNFCKEIYNK